MATVTEQWLAGRAPQVETAVSVRPIRPGDADRIYAMHRRLSPESIQARYFQYRTPSPGEIAAVCRMRPERGAGLVATLSQPAEVVVGLAYYVREMHGRGQTAELSILVEDQYQGQGIGRRLWQQIHRQAKADGIRMLRVLSSPGNRRVLRLVEGSGYTYLAEGDGWMSEYLVRLDEPFDRPRALESWWTAARSILHMSAMESPGYDGVADSVHLPV